MPLWVSDKPKNRYKQKVEIEEGSAQISDLFYNSNTLKFNAIANNAGRIKINTLYFPGWKFAINGHARDLDYKNPQGTGNYAQGSAGQERA